MSSKVGNNEAGIINTTRVSKVSEDLSSKDNDGGKASAGRVNSSNETALVNNSMISDGDSLFRKQVTELEREVVNLRDKINEIERILDADEKLLERILELDDKLKKNSHGLL
ncbi:hypothetical protein [Vulcanisaeta distributa]|uniref:hypothetical protein n=1 Tax=Vulcanisaeta distributa TaxID=164451 RepID=UPI0006D2A44B|nr:hypothetical protein [Vulcanisaeta distributa]